MKSDIQTAQTSENETPMYETTGPAHKIGRRRFMQGAGAAGVLAVAGSNSRFSPVGNAAAVVPLAPIGVAAGGAALGYLLNEGADYFLGDDADYSDYIGSNALHQDIEEGALSMQSATERVMTSIENNIEFSENVAYAKGKMSVIESLNEGLAEGDAQAALDSVVAKFYITIERNIITHWESQINQWLHMVEQVEAHDTLSLSDVFARNPLNTDGVFQGYENFNYSKGNMLGDHAYTLVDGSEITTPYIDGDSLASGDHSKIGTAPSNSLARYSVIKYEGDIASEMDVIDVIDPEREGAALDAVANRYNSVLTDLTGFAADIYSAYDRGEIDLANIVDPVTAATELRQNNDNYAVQGASAAMLGIPTTANASVVIEVSTADGPVEMTADLYTAHVPTDADGNEMGFQVGQTYDPSTWSDPLFIAYETTETDADGNPVRDFTQLESEFTVIEAYDDKAGESVESFQTVSRNMQTADASTVEEELAQIRQAQVDMQEEAQAQGGGSGGSGGVDIANEIWGIPVIGWAIGGVAGIAALLQGMNQ